MNSTEESPSLGSPEVGLLREQREQALACMILSFTIALAVVLSVFGRARENEAARKSVEIHRALLREINQGLAANQAALREVQTALEQLRRVPLP